MARESRFRASSAGGTRVPFSVPILPETRTYLHNYAKFRDVNTAEMVRLAIAEHCYKYASRQKFPAEFKDILQKYGLLSD